METLFSLKSCIVSRLQLHQHSNQWCSRFSEKLLDHVLLTVGTTHPHVHSDRHIPGQQVVCLLN